MLILAFDTATDVATSALVADGEVLGERIDRAAALLADVDALLAAAALVPAGPRRARRRHRARELHGTRIGLAVARGLALALDLPVAGVSTLDALAAGAAGAFPVVDARRGEVFVPGPRAVRARGARARPGSASASGDGAVRYRERARGAGAEVPPDDAELTCRAPRLHAALATTFGPAERSSRSTCACPTRRRWRRMSFALRRLELGDLDAIERIERASYPTPWSRSMFACELAKPSSLSLARRRRPTASSSATSCSRATSTPGT